MRTEKLNSHVEKYAAQIEKFSRKLADLYRNCYPNTLDTAIEIQEDGSVFVLTGDIPAMWLRDSTAQVSHYIPLCREDDRIAQIIRGVISRQFDYILIDPYANAFNAAPNDRGHVKDLPRKSPWVWERKYEVDSLCYPIRLLELYVKATGDRSLLDGKFYRVAETIVELWITEQHHQEKSPYRFVRDWGDWKELARDGLGTPVGDTGMTWSGFRPSDDACTYGYSIAANFFAARTLKALCDMLPEADALRQRAGKLCGEIEEGIRKYGIVKHPAFGEIYACEVDGLGNYNCLDDANVPSLLSLPYLGCVDREDEVYQNTRRFILSADNPFYYEGKYAKGVGSPHTPQHYIWHIALSMQGLTSKDSGEIKEILRMLERTDADTGYMHEGFHADDPSQFTREWFSWSNSLFAEFVEYSVEQGIL